MHSACAISGKREAYSFGPGQAGRLAVLRGLTFQGIRTGPVAPDYTMTSVAGDSRCSAFTDVQADIIEQLVSRRLQKLTPIT